MAPHNINVLILRATEPSTEHALNGARLFEELYPLLDCRTIEVVQLPNGSHKHAMLVDEDGRMRGLPPNPAASAIAGREIVGDVALIARSDLR